MNVLVGNLTNQVHAVLNLTNQDTAVLNLTNEQRARSKSNQSASANKIYLPI